MSPTARKATVRRETRETRIELTLNLDGSGQARIETGIPFFDHMLELLAKHSLFDLRLRAAGDLPVDYHHTVEDVGLTLGQALTEALGERRGITRYGWSLLPMDDALSRVALDLGGRPYLVYAVSHRKQKIRDFHLGLIEHFFRSFTDQGRLNLHIAQLYGQDPHHAYESIFKGVAWALRLAVARDPRVKHVPSSKGVL
ncbi:MAG: imidazoleglycerol-phosphate dehydratase HisB [Candidatus Marinimicrobia bacterium]|nr:imidazoleglycerol-phosphate dehydratase HisB [Candidatus Neomarinimicrobiota bacterium]